MCIRDSNMILWNCTTNSYSTIDVTREALFNKIFYGNSYKLDTSMQGGFEWLFQRIRNLYFLQVLKCHNRRWNKQIIGHKTGHSVPVYLNIHLNCLPILPTYGSTVFSHSTILVFIVYKCDTKKIARIIHWLKIFLI